MILEESVFCWKERFNKPYMYIDLDVLIKFLFLRRLADIAFKHLNKEEVYSSKTNLGGANINKAKGFDRL